MHHWGLVELYKKRNLVGDKKEFQKRGKTEKEAIRTATYCEGRTFWDHAIAILINPKAQYVICNEPLRDVFYQQPVWDIETIERHRIFVSQCSYPLKGFHFLLEALVMVKERFPDVVVYTTGPNLLSRNPKVMIRFSRYRWYLRHLFVKYHLQTNVRFLGQLDASAMKQQYLKANVFVSPSSIENSPNSVGEAMILGCPVIASDVGGVSTMMRREEDGFLYQYDAPYLLAYYIMQVFSDDALALRFSKNAQQHARITHNREQILSTQKEIYHKIVASIQEE
jgi:glycosyltransferase involved in cell wall biosynthesis